MPELPRMGGGAGCAGIRFSSGVSVIGAHLSSGIDSLRRHQVRAIAKLAAHEKILGNAVILAGDWNVEAPWIFEDDEFRKLGVVCCDVNETPTCPTFLPWRKTLDHIFLSSELQPIHTETISFGSDHLALSVEIE